MGVSTIRSGCSSWSLRRMLSTTFFLRPTSQHVAIHNAGSDGGKVSLPLQHGPHDVEIVVSQGRMHDGVHVLEGTCDPQGANVRRTGIHPVGQFSYRESPWWYIQCEFAETPWMGRQPVDRWYGFDCGGKGWGVGGG